MSRSWAPIPSRIRLGAERIFGPACLPVAQFPAIPLDRSEFLAPFAASLPFAARSKTPATSQLRHAMRRTATRPAATAVRRKLPSALFVRAQPAAQYPALQVPTQAPRERAHTLRHRMALQLPASRPAHRAPADDPGSRGC